MGTALKNRPIMSEVRQRIQRGGEHLWQLEDFSDLPFSGVAQALSRLTREGALERLSKGLYYHGRPTAFGKSRPNQTLIRRLAKNRKTFFPSGIAAANFLGFTTQTPKEAEIATTALSLPKKLIGNGIIHTRRPEAWAHLSEKDAALLDFIRHGAKFSELSREETIAKILGFLSEQGRLNCLLKIAASEPPRVRAMLGALAEQHGARSKVLRKLRDSLNPFSRFDFGLLAALPNASAWQAKKR